MTATLLPPSSSAFERAADVTFSQRTQLPVRIGDLWNPHACPLEHLPWLAWARSVDNWPAHWDAARKRQAIADSYLVHRHKGTVYAVRQTVNQFGGNILLREWWQLDPPGPPHTFELILNLADQNGETASAALVDEVIAAVHRVKPARAHFTFTQGIQARSAVSLVPAARAVQHVRLTLTEALP